MRKKELKKLLKKPICAILPSYADFGANGSTLIFEDNSSIVLDLRVKTVIKQLAKKHYKDIKLIRQQARIITKRRTGNALPITREIVLIPFKTRKPLAKDDGANGYVLQSAISKIGTEGNNTYLYLTNGRTIKVLESEETAHQKTLITDKVVNEMLGPERDREIEETLSQILRAFKELLKNNRKCDHCGGIIDKDEEEEDEEESEE